MKDLKDFVRGEKTPKIGDYVTTLKLTPFGFRVAQKLLEIDAQATEE